jgi:SAM-dependent methyltransferase
MRASPATEEIARGERFAFGENWGRFLTLVDERRIHSAEISLRSLLGMDRLDGLRLLDLGSGSGLFSLAARRLGAEVHSCDYDPDSVACTAELRRRHATDDPKWLVERGSALDEEFLFRLGTFDIVYSWGVLHHTGAMWRAVELAASAVASGGVLAIAIYNRQRLLTPFWIRVKRTYLALPRSLRPLLVWPYVVYAGLGSAATDLLRGRSPWARWRAHGTRGMNLYHDAVDWVGGWPFEAATPVEIETFLASRGFTLVRSVTVGRRHGCNEFVFHRGVGRE